LAASRLAFCGGYDLEDEEILADAAAAAGVPVDGCLAAAADPTRDAHLEATARRLRSSGVPRLPAIRIGRRWLWGEQMLSEARPLLRNAAS
jgi:2-hydroxychromene-2-carboxylate isomerase